MFKRVIWMGMGATAGAGATMWANRKVKRTVAKLAPEALTDELSARARSFGRDLVDAVVEGREAMRAREAELQQRLPPALRPTIDRTAIDRTAIDRHAGAATGHPGAGPSSSRRGTRRDPIDVNGTELAPARRALPPAGDRHTRRSRRSGRR